MRTLEAGIRNAVPESGLRSGGDHYELEGACEVEGGLEGGAMGTPPLPRAARRVGVCDLEKV